MIDEIMSAGDVDRIVLAIERFAEAHERLASYQESLVEAILRLEKAYRKTPGETIDNRKEVQITFTRAQLQILSELLWDVYREQHARKVRDRERTLEWCQFFATWATDNKEGGRHEGPG